MTHQTRSTLILLGLWGLVLLGVVAMAALFVALRSEYETKRSECLGQGGRWVRDPDILVTDGNGGLFVVPQYHCAKGP